MTLTTPAQERLPRFSCPPPQCTRCHRPGEGHLAPRSWTGPPTPIEGRRGRVGGREGAARAAPCCLTVRFPKPRSYGGCHSGGGGTVPLYPTVPRPSPREPLRLQATLSGAACPGCAGLSGCSAVKPYHGAPAGTQPHGDRYMTKVTRLFRARPSALSLALRGRVSP
jgi:hypothetical protein